MIKLFKNLLLSFVLCAILSQAVPSLASEPKNSGPKSCASLLSDLGVRTHAFTIPALESSRFFDRFVAELWRPSYRGQTGFAVYSEFLTRTHAGFENNFQVRNPETGYYDKFVPVRVNPVPAVIPKSQLDKLVQSTQPMLRFLRSLLQRVYSGVELTPDALGLQGMAPESAEVLIQVLRDSIYFEPKLLHPQMKDYPFLAVSGFDGAIGNPTAVDAKFFEMNLGTPSGLSNNFLLLEALTNEVGYLNLPRDDTFSILRAAIEDNARSWTGAKDGISVIVSPGEYNGAHPDVAFISRRTGMPMVRLADLYIDEQGFARLNLGPGVDHPKVTGIYGRMEESFFLQSNLDGIPMIGPQFANNAELGAKLGLSLRPGANYKFIWGANGQIVDVERDVNGNPMFQEVWDSLGQDPNRPNAERGSMLKAVQGRRLYYSALGGRLVDDKRLFPILSDYLKKIHPHQLIAEPVKTLAKKDYAQFFSRPDLFVVKLPDMSGGQGVSFPALMDKTALERLLKDVRANPGHFEIQYISEVTTLPEMTEDGNLIQVATDLRIFVMMDSKGKVRAGPNSVLLRTAAPGELHSNTSKGGGYGIAVVVDSNSQGRRAASWAREKRAYESEIKTVPIRRLEQLSRTLDGLLEAARWIAESGQSNLSQERRTSLLQLSYQMREVMDLLPRSLLKAIPRLRDFAQNQNLDIDKVKHFLEGLGIAADTTEEIPEVTRSIFKKYAPEIEFVASSAMAFEGRRGERWAKVKLRFLEEPETVYWWLEGKRRLERQEYAVYEQIDDPVLSAILEEIKAAGGELRISRVKVIDGDKVYYKSEQVPYFWVNYSLHNLTSYLRPVISIDLSKEDALEALSHEKGHFNFYGRELHKANQAGLEGLEAAKVAAERAHSDEGSLLSEREAVADEMKSQREYRGHLFAGSYRALEIWEKGYINRITYPEFWSLKRWLLIKKGGSKDPMVDEMIEDRMSQILDRVVEVKTQLKKMKLDPKVSRDRTKLASIKSTLARSDYELMLFPYGYEDLTKDQTFDEFSRYLEKLRAKKGLNHVGLPRQ